ncbi:sensor histidine kinase [Tardiphaga sp.]|uniref:sensor histidine kinase n=1 Tax=Tardiphaga sp. TaxID=1926292 RepID=UPI0037DA341C
MTDEVGRDELAYRLHQQTLLVEFGRSALQMRDLPGTLQRACELSAKGLNAPFAKVLEYDAGLVRLVVRAGVGWREGTIDQASLGADLDSPAGFAYRTGTAIISNHLAEETRFRTPALLASHGIKRAVNVLIRKGGDGEAPFGILEVDSPDPGQFDTADAGFLAGFAALLGIAIERQQSDQRLRELAEHQETLSREMSHRVKNSLASVAGLLHLQAKASDIAEVRKALESAAARVVSIAEVHDHLWKSAQVGFVELSDFVGALCARLQDFSFGHSVTYACDNMLLSADKAIPLGLLVNELVTNAAKHAFLDVTGSIHVSVKHCSDFVSVEVADQGKGLPMGFDLNAPRNSLGLRVVTAMLRQLNGEITIVPNMPNGTRFQLNIPIRDSVAGEALKPKMPSESDNGEITSPNVLEETAKGSK